MKSDQALICAKETAEAFFNSEIPMDYIHAHIRANFNELEESIHLELYNLELETFSWQLGQWITEQSDAAELVTTKADIEKEVAKRCLAKWPVTDSAFDAFVAMNTHRKAISSAIHAREQLAYLDDLTLVA
ncbi:MULTISPECIES: hypothetical protein [Vibrio]|nr:hypothetical protein [Vibrio tasmaniensis]TKG32609.1 hypothetical protein FC057_12395 [Vibrio tasmaniensis]TKG41707.1 hypothetical protein FC063_07545 [Vibrio tasmaniensis]TKG52062.1 hypothetical protein FC070_09815 [Vibrio tasmaniensis]TKG62508.1 hypothetical protein FC066_12415 [Vibrio tasmaniensis]